MTSQSLCSTVLPDTHTQHSAEAKPSQPWWMTSCRLYTTNWSWRGPVPTCTWRTVSPPPQGKTRQARHHSSHQPQEGSEHHPTSARWRCCTKRTLPCPPLTPGVATVSLPWRPPAPPRKAFLQGPTLPFLSLMKEDNKPPRVPCSVPALWSEELLMLNDPRLLFPPLVGC